jgi:hypothetical protein
MGKAILSYINGNIDEKKLKKEFLSIFEDLKEFYDNSIIVNESKRRRDKAEEICSVIVPMLRDIRYELKNYMDNYFLKRSLILNKSFDKISSNDHNKVKEGLSDINTLYGKKLNSISVDSLKSSLLIKK